MTFRVQLAVIRTGDVTLRKDGAKRMNTLLHPYMPVVTFWTVHTCMHLNPKP